MERKGSGARTTPRSRQDSLCSIGPDLAWLAGGRHRSSEPQKLPVSVTEFRIPWPRKSR
jgi:hypothetical protein